jgi:uncharacterized cupredoxin-like copper-binding protein
MRRSIFVLLVCGAAASTALTGLSFAGAESPKSTGVTTTIRVSMTEYNFNLSANSAPVGTVVFEITNDGEAPHDFSIAGKRSDTIATGARTTLTVFFSSSGTQPYLCTLPGHAEAGMQGTLTITGASTTKLSAVVNAALREWKIGLTSARGANVTSVRHGLVRFKVRNAGKLPHNFVLARHQTIVLKRGGRATLDVLLKAGRYKYVCSVKGHAALGMRGRLVVR